MEKTIYNIAKSRLETIDIDFTKENTTWFEDKPENKGIQTLTDFKGGLLINEYNYDYPVLIYDITREDINGDIDKIIELKEELM